MSWHTGRLAGFDTETGGVDVENDRIVTACVALVGGQLPTEVTNWLSDVDGTEIPAEAAAVHGITTEKARAEGRPAADVIDEVTGSLAAAVADGVPIVAMNATFDLTILDRECRRHGVTPLVDRTDAVPRVIDPRVIDKQVDRYRRGGRTLTDLCTHYRVALDGAHAADADAVAACRVVWRLAQMHRAIREASLDVLHKKQTEWAAKQAAGLAAYFARTPGKEHLADSVRGDWPLIPYRATEVLS